MGSVNDSESRWSSYKPGDKVVYKSNGYKLKVGTVTSVGSSVKLRDITSDRAKSIPFSKVTGRFKS